MGWTRWSREMSPWFTTNWYRSSRSMRSGLSSTQTGISRWVLSTGRTIWQKRSRSCRSSKLKENHPPNPNKQLSSKELTRPKSKLSWSLLQSRFQETVVKLLSSISNTVQVLSLIRAVQTTNKIVQIATKRTTLLQERCSSTSRKNKKRNCEWSKPMLTSSRRVQTH